VALAGAFFVFGVVGGGEAWAQKANRGSDATAGAAAESRASAVPALENRELDLLLAGLYDTNINREPRDDLHSQAFMAGFEGEYENALSDASSLRARYRLRAYRFTEISKWDRFNHDLRAEYTWHPGARWTVEAIGRVSLGVPLIEYTLADHYIARGRVEYRFGREHFTHSRTHRVRAYAAYRLREYTDDSTGAHSPFFGGDYRYRFGSWHYIDVRYSFETNRAERERRRFERSDFQLRYTRPFSEDDRLRAGLRYRRLEYEGRIVELEGDAEAPRREGRWRARLTWIRDLGSQVRMESRYRYLLRHSNEPERDFNAHRLTVSLRYRF
jgi:hypothetical protein